jgi:hypothetical protein
MQNSSVYCLGAFLIKQFITKADMNSKVQNLKAMILINITSLSHCYRLLYNAITMGFWREPSRQVARVKKIIRY